MAIAATVLTSSSDTTDATSYTTASISPAANSLLLVFVGTSNSGTSTAAVCTPSGLSLTFTSQANLGYGSTTNDVRRLQALTAQCGASPGSGALTLSMDVTSTHASWVVIQITGHNTTTPVVQAVSNKADTGTAGSATLAAGSNAGNRPFSWWGSRAGGAGVTPATSWTELYDSGAISTPTMIQEAQWRSDAFDTAAAATFASSSNWGGIALEIAVSTGTSATVNAVAATATATATPAPAVAAGSTVTGVKATATAQAVAPVVTASAVVTAVKATATATAVAPVVTAFNPSVTAVKATATATALAPVVSASSIVTAVRATATATARQSVVITANALVTAVRATATAQALAPAAVGRIPQVWAFEPPIYDVQVEPDRLIKRPRYQLTQSTSVVRIGGVLQSFKSPTLDMLEAAGRNGTDYFLGGHVYVVNDAVADELIAAGFPATPLGHA